MKGKPPCSDKNDPSQPFVCVINLADGSGEINRLEWKRGPYGHNHSPVGMGKGFSKCADPTGNKMKQMLLGRGSDKGS